MLICGGTRRTLPSGSAASNVTGCWRGVSDIWNSACMRPPAYLEAAGVPDFSMGGLGQALIAFLHEDELPVQTAWLAGVAPNARAMLHTGNQETRFQAAVQGRGMTVLPRFRADAEPGLERLLTPTPITPVEIWLAVHQDDRRASRVRRYSTP
jgi:DNA-binding transcriptional LysR family regulator